MVVGVGVVVNPDVAVMVDRPFYYVVCVLIMRFSSASDLSLNCIIPCSSSVNFVLAIFVLCFVLLLLLLLVVLIESR